MNGHIWYRRLFQMSTSAMKAQRELGGGRKGARRARGNVLSVEESGSSCGYYDDLLSDETLRKLGRASRLADGGSPEGSR